MNIFILLTNINSAFII